MEGKRSELVVVFFFLLLLALGLLQSDVEDPAEGVLNFSVVALGEVEETVLEVEDAVVVDDVQGTGFETLENVPFALLVVLDGGEGDSALLQEVLAAALEVEGHLLLLLLLLEIRLSVFLGFVALGHLSVLKYILGFSGGLGESAFTQSVVVVVFAVDTAVVVQRVLH